MTNNTNINKFFFSILFYFLIITNSFSEILKKFNINGNERVSNETIIMFSKLKLGEEINQNKLNDALKELYSTNYFNDVVISSDNGSVNILVKENPIIQSIKINGIKKDKIYENVKNITSKLEKYPFVETKINDQVKLLKNILKSFGYYFVELKTSFVTNNNNTIDLIYDFELGEIAKIKKINFIGNKVFRDNTLRNVIVSEEDKFWKFITSNKFLNSNRISLDVSRLEEFYKNRGYFNVSIKSTTAIVNEKNNFELIFNINANEKYFFDQVIFKINNNIPEENLEYFNRKYNRINGKPYSSKRLNNLVTDLNNFTLENDFIFVNANYKEVIKKNNLIDVIISFDEIEKNYVERINIFGNFITDEKVIRNKLIVDEGDPYNEKLFNKSLQDLRAMNIFKSVKSNTNEINKDSKIINIVVEEKPTGEIFAGAGTGTTGSSISAGIKENNYLGLGIKLDTNFTITDDSIKGKFSVINPNINNSDRLVKTEIESSSTDFMSSSGYKTDRTGFTIGTEFEQKNDVFVNLEFSTFYEDLETASSATSIVKKQEGTYFENLISYNIKYNKLDQNFQPTDGFINNFSQTLPLYSDDLSVENNLNSALYHSINDNLILSAKLFLRAINSIDDNVRVSKRVHVPSRMLRGFESGKIGPKEGTQYIGGNYAAALNLNTTLPDVFFENENIDLNFFIDMANVWEVDYNSSLDSSKIRSSTGLAINWFSAIGPLTFSYAIPLSEKATDITENFRFQIGTSF